MHQIFQILWDIPSCFSIMSWSLLLVINHTNMLIVDFSIYSVRTHNSWFLGIWTLNRSFNKILWEHIWLLSTLEMEEISPSNHTLSEWSAVWIRTEWINCQINISFRLLNLLIFWLRNYLILWIITIHCLVSWWWLCSGWCISQTIHFRYLCWNKMIIRWSQLIPLSLKIAYNFRVLLCSNNSFLRLSFLTNFC